MNSVILWIEDRPATVSQQIQEIKRSGYKVIVQSMPHEVKKTFAKETVVAIVIDVMLYGVRNLDSIGLPNVGTSEGMDAGWALLEYFIRANDSPYRDIPVLVLSAHVFGDEQKRHVEQLQINAGPIEYLEKYQENWQAKFSDWLKSLPKGN